MSVPEQINALEELAALDAELKTLGDEIGRERGSLEGLRSKHTELEDKVKNDKAHLAAIEKLRNDYVVEVRNMMQQLEHSREKMNRARNEREANAAQRELEELRKLIRDREDEIGKLTTDGDASRQQIDATEEEAKKVSTELGETEGSVQARLGDTERQQAKRASTRDAIVKRLPAQVYRRYEVIRGRRGTGIAQTTDGTCKACNMSLPPQLFHRLRREPLLDQCPSCQRIIYYSPPATEPEAADPKG